MLRCISVLLMSALLTVGFTTTVALAAPHTDDHGLPRADPGDTNTGEPTDPTTGESVANDFGTVTSQLGTTEHSVGEHSSDPLPTRCVGVGESCGETPRDGVGNVSRTDAGTATRCGVEDTGGSPGHHAAIIDGCDTNEFTDVTKDPGLPEELRGPA
jgi:hypothetical protein